MKLDGTFRYTNGPNQHTYRRKRDGMEQRDGAYFCRVGPGVRASRERRESSRPTALVRRKFWKLLHFVGSHSWRLRSEQRICNVFATGMQRLCNDIATGAREARPRRQWIPASAGMASEALPQAWPVAGWVWVIRILCGRPFYLSIGRTLRLRLGGALLSEGGCGPGASYCTSRALKLHPLL